VKGGVFDFYLRKLTIGVGEKHVGDFPAMTFGERNGERVFGRLAGWTLWRRSGNMIELFEDEPDGVTDFQRVEFSPCMNIA
jgi:hypothetical protein